jgi:anaerobic magnesium-protoporphyrin IX monomethyl ester cyclase
MPLASLWYQLVCLTGHEPMGVLSDLTNRSKRHNMRFLLVNPFYPLPENPSPPLGIAYLAAALERAGAEVKVLDFVVTPYSKGALESELNGFMPQVVGVTAVSMTFDNAIQVVRDVKSIAPDVVTVMGGPHVSFCAEETLDSFPELEVIALGEGEETVVDLAREASDGQNWKEIRGIVYRDGSKILKAPTREPIGDLSKLPLPARHLIPLGRYRALGMPVSMTTSRGCPFKCIFCVGRKMVGSKVRYRDPGMVVDEFGYLAGLDFTQINIADDLFTANRNHCLSVCREIMARKIKARWSSFARVDTVSREVLEAMKEAGCTTVSFGVESANPDILKTIRKGITLEQVIAAINLCIEVGILPHVSFILGLPGETPDTLKETEEFGRRLKDMGALYGFHLLSPFPGTEVREENESYGIRILTNDWSQYHANRAIVETPAVNRAMMDAIVIEWEDEFNEWLGYVQHQMLKGEATKEEAWQIIRLEHTVLIYDLMMGKIIENYGSFTCGEGPISGDAALNRLVKLLLGSTSYQEKKLRDTLRFSVEQGYLRWYQQGDRIRWEWAEFL